MTVPGFFSRKQNMRPPFAMSWRLRMRRLNRFVCRREVPMPNRTRQRLPNLHTVFDWYVCPGLTIDDGNAGLLGESG